MVSHVVQKDVLLVQIEAGLYLYQKQIAPEFIQKWTKTTSESVFQSDCLVHASFQLSVFTPAQKVWTNGGNKLWSV